MTETLSAEAYPTRFNHQQACRQIYDRWESAGLFHAQRDEQKEPFTIVIPPPNVTGALHLGHALNNTLQDVLIRMKRMQGYAALWMPGTDHAGIATQAVVERRLKEEENKTRHDLGREELVKRIWDWKEQYETRILGQLRQMGSSCDWERTRFTLDPVCATAVRKTFADLFEQQKIYRGKRLVNWDTFLQTAVSDDEVFHETTKGHFWHFQYPVIDPKPGEPTHVTIATTRPETMLGDTAVAVHPDPAAALDKVQQQLREKLSKANQKEQPEIEKQIVAIDERCAEMLPQLEQLRDMAADGRLLMLPLVNREIPLIADKWAKPELGSGCVKITPAHDPNDYEVGLRCQLPMINILNPDGTMNAHAGTYQGLNIKQARKAVIADLEAAELMVEIEDREIEIAHSDRSKTAIEPFLAHQWFVRMDELAQSAMDAVSDERVKIFPSRYRKGYLDWLSEKRDWCISRNLWWGHQIPIWSHTCQTEADYAQLQKLLSKDEYLLNESAFYQVEYPAKNATESELADNPPFAIVQLCIAAENTAAEAHYESLGFERESDVLDTWFSSALWPHSTLGWPTESEDLSYFYPTSTLITSRDIITLWVARMVLMGLNNMEDIPFSEVFIHPKILDGYGETMSKSKGNGIDPLEIIENLGADSLRFGMAHLTTETQDVRMPAQFQCPACEHTFDQTKKNRALPRVACPKCDAEFRTQWAESEADLALPKGLVLSERFEQGRNFCNKLWNAARFVLLNLQEYSSGNVQEAELEVEDRWILSRLATVTAGVTEALEHYHYSDAVRLLYEFAWDEFCSFYVEMTKQRMQDPQLRMTAQRVIVHTLDQLLRLLHPIIPFITEEIWEKLNQAAPIRGISAPEEAAQFLMSTSWPQSNPEHINNEIEEQFAQFQSVLGALREIRSRQNIPPKAEIEFALRCNSAVEALLKPMSAHFVSLAGARITAWGEEITPPATNATVPLSGMDVYVDLKDFIDVDKEKARLEKEINKMAGMISGKEKKLSNENFTSRAPAEVVAREKKTLVEMKEQLEVHKTALKAL